MHHSTLFHVISLTFRYTKVVKYVSQFGNKSFLDKIIISLSYILGNTSIL